MLAKSGGLKKGDIGAIRITERQTFVEIAPKGVERFLATIGPDMKIEAAITVSRVDGKPDLSRKSSDGPRSRDRNSKPRRSRKKPYGDARKGDRKDRDGDKKPRASKDGKPPRKNTSLGQMQNYEEGSFKRKARKTTGDGVAGGEAPKKPHKKKLARAAALKAKAEGKKGKRKKRKK